MTAWRAVTRRPALRCLAASPIVPLPPELGEGIHGLLVLRVVQRDLELIVPCNIRGVGRNLGWSTHFLPLKCEFFCVIGVEWASIDKMYALALPPD